MEELLRESKLSEIFTMGAQVELEEVEEPEVALYFASPDISATLAFTAEEWRQFADRVAELDDKVPF